MKRKSFCMRLDPDLVEKTKKLGVDLNQVLENQMRKLLRQNKCPVCGSKKNVEVILHKGSSER